MTEPDESAGAVVHDFPDPAVDPGELTPRQRRVLEVIRSAVERRGYPPSMREIGEAAGLASPSSVSHQLRVLETKGFIRRDPNRPLALECCRRPVRRAARVPPKEWTAVSTRSRPTSTRQAVATGTRRRPMCRWSAASPRAVQFWPSRRSRRSSRSPTSWWGMEPCSSSTWSATRWWAAICDGDWVVVRQQPVAEHRQRPPR